MANFNQCPTDPSETAAASKRLSDVSDPSTYAAKPGDPSGTRQSQTVASPTIQPEIIASTHSLLRKMLLISRTKPINIAATTPTPDSAPSAPPPVGKEATKYPQDGAGKVSPSPELSPSKPSSPPRSSPGMVGVLASVSCIPENDECSPPSSVLPDSSPDETKKPVGPENGECPPPTSAPPESPPENSKKPDVPKMLSACKASEHGTPAPARRVMADESDDEGHELSAIGILQNVVGVVPDSTVLVPGMSSLPSLPVRI
jgi:hypothetical protein